MHVIRSELVLSMLLVGSMSGLATGRAAAGVVLSPAARGALARASRAELPAVAARLLAQTPSSQQGAEAEALVQVVADTRPGALAATVAALVAELPQDAPGLAGTAAGLAPDFASAIAAAASRTAPAFAGRIATAVQAALSTSGDHDGHGARNPGSGLVGAPRLPGAGLHDPGPSPDGNHVDGRDRGNLGGLLRGGDHDRGVVGSHDDGGFRSGDHDDHRGDHGHGDGDNDRDDQGNYARP